MRKFRIEREEEEEEFASALLYEATRQVLTDYEGQRKNFIAQVGAEGMRENNPALRTLCLQQVYLTNGLGEGFFVSDHVWVDCNRALSRAFVERGQWIRFKADVIHYMKGGPKKVSTRCGRRRIKMKYTGHDYGLRRFGCVQTTEPPTQGELQ